MKTPRNRLDARIHRGRTRLKKAEEDIRLLSGSRLDELLKLSAALRFEHLDDPDLIPSDRLKLRKSISSTLPLVKKSRLSEAFRRHRPIGIGRWMRRRGAALIISLIIGGPLCSFAAYAWSNTGDLVDVSQEGILTWHTLSGGSEVTRVRAGDRLIISRSLWSTSARRWIIGKGYEIARLQ